MPQHLTILAHEAQYHTGLTVRPPSPVLSHWARVIPCPTEGRAWLMLDRPGYWVASKSPADRGQVAARLRRAGAPNPRRPFRWARVTEVFVLHDRQHRTKWAPVYDVPAYCLTDAVAAQTYCFGGPVFLAPDANGNR